MKNSIYFVRYVEKYDEFYLLLPQHLNFEFQNEGIARPNIFYYYYDILNILTFY